MSETFPYRTDSPPAPELATRLQARLDELDPDVEGTDADGSTAHDVEASEAWVARTTAQHAEGLELRINRLDRQLKILREQLDQAFDEIDERLADTETRVGVAESRASVAEARASVAESRAADAETRANDAHHRVDDLLAELTRIVAGPAAQGSEKQDLRGALDRLRDRLDVG